MLFKQLFDKTSCTFTYLIADLDSRKAVFIDPVDTNVDEYLAFLKSHNLELTYAFETHVHADHISGSGLLRQATGAQTCIGVHCGAETADFQLHGEEVFTLGDHANIKTLSTPGHTPGSMSFLWNDRVFTGDALFIGGCGRTDFQNGDPGDLYDSITQKIFTLPDETLIYPGHDYKGDCVSCVYQEKTKNPRLAGKSRDEFIDIMNNLNLPMPKLIDIAVPANLYCGIEEEEAQQWADNSDLSTSNNQQENVNSAKFQVKEIDVKSAKNLLTDNPPIILDVRENNEFNLGHIENAINIPRGELLTNVESILTDKNKDTQVLLYCASGNRSALAAVIMEDLGYSNVISLSGGYVKWMRDAA